MTEPKQFRLTCDAIKAGKKTRNGRIYSQAVLEDAAKRVNGRAAARTLFGQIGVPVDGVTRLADASHLVTACTVEKGRLVAQMEVLDTPAGRDLLRLIETGGRPALVPRGHGSIGPDGVIGSDYLMETFDVVLEEPNAKSSGQEP